MTPSPTAILSRCSWAAWSRRQPVGGAVDEQQRQQHAADERDRPGGGRRRSGPARSRRRRTAAGRGIRRCARADRRAGRCRAPRVRTPAPPPEGGALDGRRPRQRHGRGDERGDRREREADEHDHRHVEVKALLQGLGQPRAGGGVEMPGERQRPVRPPCAARCRRAPGTGSRPRRRSRTAHRSTRARDDRDDDVQPHLPEPFAPPVAAARLRRPARSPPRPRRRARSPAGTLPRPPSAARPRPADRG